MNHPHDHHGGAVPPGSARPIVLLGDTDTIEQRQALEATAHQHDRTISQAYAFRPGEALAVEDLSNCEPVVDAIARCLTAGHDLWVPYPHPDLGREQHLRRIGLVLKRAGLNLLLSTELQALPDRGAFNSVDQALRTEVARVDDLTHAATARAAATPLLTEIDSWLSTSRAAEPIGPVGPPLPTPTEAWARRLPVLERFARWMTATGATQAETAAALNAHGQTTRRGLPWTQSTVSALIGGRYRRKRKRGARLTTDRSGR